MVFAHVVKMVAACHRSVVNASPVCRWLAGCTVRLQGGKTRYRWRPYPMVCCRVRLPGECVECQVGDRVVMREAHRRSDRAGRCRMLCMTGGRPDRRTVHFGVG